MLRQKWFWSEVHYLQAFSLSPTFNLVFSFCNGHSGWQKDPQRNPKLFLTLTSKIFWMRCFCRPDLKKSFDLLSRLTQDTPAEVKGHTGQTPPDPKRSPEGSKTEKGSEGAESSTKVTRKESYLRGKRYLFLSESDQKSWTRWVIGDGGFAKRRLSFKKERKTLKGFFLAVFCLSTFCF